jgi:hypothetical protein
MPTQWSFAGFTFPWEDSPEKRGADDWNWEEKLIEHEPLMASVTILTSWGFRSRNRTITGSCSATTRDTMQTFQLNGTVGALVDSEGRSMNARITKAKFVTQLPKDAALLDCEGNPADGRYRYSIEFLER